MNAVRVPRVQALPGHICQPDASRGYQRPPHVISDPADDEELLVVSRWLKENKIESRARRAIDDAIRYVLESERTRRFSLIDPEVDSDERASVGTKLQYRIIEQLGLTKQAPLDTHILGVAVEIKTTVRGNWMIPREGQCEVTLLFRIDPQNHEFEVRLIRAHRAWLNAENRDKKRSFAKGPLTAFSTVIVAPSPLPDEPLRLLTEEQLSEVLGKGGMRRRLVNLFSMLPETVIPRGTISIVGAGLNDPMKRAREAKTELREKGLIVLVGTWKDERETAAALGFDISDEAWIAIEQDTFLAQGVALPAARTA